MNYPHLCMQPIFISKTALNTSYLHTLAKLLLIFSKITPVRAPPPPTVKPSSSLEFTSPCCAQQASRKSLRTVGIAINAHQCRKKIGAWRHQRFTRPQPSARKADARIISQAQPSQKRSCSHKHRYANDLAGACRVAHAVWRMPCGECHVANAMWRESKAARRAHYLMKYSCPGTDAGSFNSGVMSLAGTRDKFSSPLRSCSAASTFNGPEVHMAYGKLMKRFSFTAGISFVTVFFAAGR